MADFFLIQMIFAGELEGCIIARADGLSEEEISKKFGGQCSGDISVYSLPDISSFKNGDKIDTRSIDSLKEAKRKLGEAQKHYELMQQNYVAARNKKL